MKIENLLGEFMNDETRQQFKECGIEDLNVVIENLIMNAEPIELLLMYHNKFAEPSLSFEDREKILSEYYKLITDQSNVDKMKTFIMWLKKLDGKVVECILKNNCSKIQQLYNNIIGKYMTQIVQIVNLYGKEIKDLMKWMASISVQLSDQCNVDMTDIRTIYNEVCDMHCYKQCEQEKPSQPNYILIISAVIIIVIAILVMFIINK